MVWRFLLAALLVVGLISPAQAAFNRNSKPKTVPAAKPIIKITPLQDGRYLLEPLIPTPPAPGSIVLTKAQKKSTRIKEN